MKNIRAERGVNAIPRPAPTPQRAPFPVLPSPRIEWERVVGSGWLSPLVAGLSESAELTQEADTTEAATSPAVKVYPSLAAAWQRDERTAEARIWLLLREMDVQGQGWISIDDMREKLSSKSSKFRVCGQRRLRAIVRAGNGTFWHRDKIGRLWIHGAVQVGIAFNVRRLKGHNVEISIDDLTNGMERFNATLYAVFHAARTSAPISRATITALTGISDRRQREYDEIAHVERERNFSIEEARTQASAEEHAWQHQRASFSFTDYTGKQGEAGRTYNARRLPNSYKSPLQRGTNGRKKKINSKLSESLVTYRAQGQSETALERVFFTDARTAEKTANAAHSPILRLSGRKDYGLWMVYNAA